MDQEEPTGAQLVIAAASQTREALGWKKVGIGTLLLVAVVVALLAPAGPLASTAICIAVLAGMGWVSAVVDHTVCHWYMQAVSLEDVVRPRDPALESLDRILAEPLADS